MVRKFKNKTLPKGILIARGYVWVRVFSNGRPIQKCIGPLSTPRILDLAIAKLNHYREQLRLGKLSLEEKSQRLTFEQAADIYWDLHASKKDSHKSFKVILKSLKNFFEKKYIDALTYVDVQNYRRQREKTLKASTVNRDHTVITHLFNKLKEWKRLRVIKNIKLPDENPGSLVRKVNEKQFSRKRVVTPDEFDKFMQHAPMEVKRICLGALHTTLRLKDLRLLTRNNVNEATNQLEGTQAKTRKPYAIPINGAIRQLIDTAAGRSIFDFTNFRKQFEAARTQSSLTDFEFRDLRRTGARTMLKKGVDIATVSSYLGHTSLVMTENYVPSSKDDKRIAGEILGTMYQVDLNQNCDIEKKTTPVESPEDTRPKVFPRASGIYRERLA